MDQDQQRIGKGEESSVDPCSTATDPGNEQKTEWHTIIFDESIQTGAAEYTYEGTHRYHGVVLIRLKDNKIFRWREYQHIDDRDWQTFVSSTMFD